MQRSDTIMVRHVFNVHSLVDIDYNRNALLRKADSPVERTIKLMISTIALVIIAIAICVLTIIYYRKRKDLVQQLSDIDYSLVDIRAKLNKLDNINNKLLAVENKVQSSIDKITSVKTNIENSVIERLISIKKDQDLYINKLYSKINTLQDTVDNITKENDKRYKNLVDDIDKRIVSSECRAGTKINSLIDSIDTIGGRIVIALEEKKNHCGAKNSSKVSKTNNTTKANKQENDKLKTAK